MGANPAFVGIYNCWLKTIGVPCVLPEYAEAYLNSYLLMRQVPGCEPPSPSELLELYPTAAKQSDANGVTLSSGGTLPYCH
jgi:hypothetical protein